MVIETGVVVGYLIAWAVRKAKLAGGRLDAEVDAVMDAGLDKLHEVVAAKLGTDPALTELEEEAVTGEQVSELTRQRVELSVRAAAGKDSRFDAAVAALVEQLRISQEAGRTGSAAAVGQDAVAAGDIDIRAQDGSAAAWRMGDVTIGQSPTDPSRPGRSRD